MRHCLSINRHLSKSAFIPKGETLSINISGQGDVTRNDFYKRNNISLKIFPRQPWVIECDMINYHKLIGKFLRCHRCHHLFIY